MERQKNATLKKCNHFTFSLKNAPFQGEKISISFTNAFTKKKQGFHLETSKMFLQQKKCNTFETAHQKRRCLLLHLFLKKSSFQKKYVLRTTDPSSKIALKKHHNEKMTQVWAYEWIGLGLVSSQMWISPSSDWEKRTFKTMAWKKISVHTFYRELLGFIPWDKRWTFMIAHEIYPQQK